MYGIEAACELGVETIHCAPFAGATPAMPDDIRGLARQGDHLFRHSLATELLRSRDLARDRRAAAVGEP